MALYLNGEAYIVSGKHKDCIYDLRNSKLYHISKSVTALIDQLLENDIEKFSTEEIKTILQLKNWGVLTEQKNPYKKDIKELCKPHKLKTAWIEIITFCNLKCRHCYEESTNKRTEKMTLQDFKYAIDALSEYGIETVILIGGEPFCHPNLKEMIEYSCKKIPKTAVFTNGTIIDEQWCNFLKSHNVTMGISMYSYLPDMHDKVTTVNGSYDKTKKTLELFDKYKITHKIATVHMKDIELGKCDSCSFQLDPIKDPVRLAGRGNLSLITPELMRNKLITKDRFSVPLDKNWIVRALNGHQCFSIKIYIEYNLDIRPCVMEHRRKHKNLRGKAISDILNQEIVYFNKDKVEECRDCEFRYNCHDCRADSINGNFYAKPYVCTYDVYNGEWANPDTHIETIFKKYS